MSEETANSSNRIRGANGVVCSLVELPGKTLRIVLDDVDNESAAGLGPWLHRVLFTFKDYPADTLRDLELSEQELAAFGFHVLVRILAVNGQLSAKAQDDGSDSE
jgi:hypothetical protein